MATVYTNIGSVYTRQGEYKKALEYYSKALDISRFVLGENHPSIATSYNNIGVVSYSKTIEVQNRILEIQSTPLLHQNK